MLLWTQMKYKNKKIWKGIIKDTWSKPWDARLQWFKIKRKSQRFAEVFIIFTLTHKVLREKKKKTRQRIFIDKSVQPLCEEWTKGEQSEAMLEQRHCLGTLMSARSSVNCSSDMDADWSVSLLSSSARFCRASRISTKTTKRHIFLRSSLCTVSEC